MPVATARRVNCGDERSGLGGSGCRDEAGPEWLGWFSADAAWRAGSRGARGGCSCSKGRASHGDRVAQHELVPWLGWYWGQDYAVNGRLGRYGWGSVGTGQGNGSETAHELEENFQFLPASITRKWSAPTPADLRRNDAIDFGDYHNHGVPPAPQVIMSIQVPTSARTASMPYRNATNMNNLRLHQMGQRETCCTSSAERGILDARKNSPAGLARSEKQTGAAAGEPAAPEPRSTRKGTDKPAIVK